MSTPKKPRFTDLDRFPRPYADAKATSEPGYLAAKFRAIRESQEKADEERRQKLRTLRK